MQNVSVTPPHCRRPLSPENRLAQPLFLPRGAIADRSGRSKLAGKIESLLHRTMARPGPIFIQIVGIGTDHNEQRFSFPQGGQSMARKTKKKRRYSKSAGRDVKNEMHRYKKGTARSGRRGKGGKVKSRKQAIAIGLSKARKKGKKVPKKKS
jgi:Family of unknown function (DUF6496)